MTMDELENIYNPAIKALGMCGGKDWVSIIDAECFDRFMGRDWYLSFQEGNTKSLPDKDVRLLRGLAGPHGKTILAAYRVKNDLKD